MPTYEYRCEGCGRTVEVVQSFADAPLTTCEACKGALRKVFAPVGIVFKGSGFYKTDSRSSSARRSTSIDAGSSESKDGATASGTKEGATDGAKAASSGSDAASSTSPAPAGDAKAPSKSTPKATTTTKSSD